LRGTRSWDLGSPTRCRLAPLGTTQSYQSIEADGVFAEMAANSLGEPVPDLSAQLYNPSYNKDRFENTALTIDGRVGALKLFYAGAYLVRNVEQVQDYTNYSHAYQAYYQCAFPPATAQTRCSPPSLIRRLQLKIRLGLIP